MKGRWCHLCMVLCLLIVGLCSCTPCGEPFLSNLSVEVVGRAADGTPSELRVTALTDIRGGVFADNLPPAEGTEVEFVVDPPSALRVTPVPAYTDAHGAARMSIRLADGQDCAMLAVGVDGFWSVPYLVKRGVYALGEG